MAVVEPANVDRFMEICAKWDVQATVVGEVIEGDRLIIESKGEVIVDVDPKTVAHEGPVYERPFHRPAKLDEIQADAAEDLPRDNAPEALRETLLGVLAHGNVADKSWVTDQYDRYVRGNTVLSQPEDAGMLRIDEETHLGIALALDANSRFTYLNPGWGAQQSLAEAYRNIAVTGAQPVAITDCLNFGSPEDPEVMYTFVEAIKGLVDACAELGLPVTGGNVSLYNQTASTPILPTPTIGVLGVIDDVRTRIRKDFTTAGDAVVLLGDTLEELSGSIWADVAHSHLGGQPPEPNLTAEAALASLFGEAAQLGLLSSAHDLSDGGLAVALAESVFATGLGVSVDLPGADHTVALFSESPARAVVSLPSDRLDQLEELATRHRVPFTWIGEVTDTSELELGPVTISVDEARRAWTQTIPTAIS